MSNSCESNPNIFRINLLNNSQSQYFQYFSNSDEVYSVVDSTATIQEESNINLSSGKYLLTFRCISRYSSNIPILSEGNISVSIYSSDGFLVASEPTNPLSLRSGTSMCYVIYLYFTITESSTYMFKVETSTSTSLTLLGVRSIISSV